MNAEKLEQAGIDYQRGVKRFVGRAALYEKALTKFLKDGSFDRIRTAYETRDDEQLLACAHELKGMCGNIAMPALYAVSDEIVQLLRGGEYTAEELREAFLRLKNYYYTAFDAIQAEVEAAQ